MLETFNANEQTVGSTLDQHTLIRSLFQKQQAAETGAPTVAALTTAVRVLREMRQKQLRQKILKQDYKDEDMD